MAAAITTQQLNTLTTMDVCL